MNEDAKKTALRMIPYGLYVLTAEGKNGAVAAATVNWVTQSAFRTAPGRPGCENRLWSACHHQGNEGVCAQYPRQRPASDGV